MLKSLYIRDYALIEELEVNFSNGLNIITGETGAGKSILIGGLKLILGERAQSTALRTGSKKAVVEGVFELPDRSLVADILLDEGFDLFDDVVLRREVTENKSRAFINDSPASVAQMKRVANELVDLHGQHEHQSLLKESRHLTMVDAMGDHGDMLREYRIVFVHLEELHRAWSGLKSRETELQEKRELLSFQIQEIETVDPLPVEQQSLEKERQILENAEHLYSQSLEVFEALYGSDNSVLSTIVKARNELQDLSRIDPYFEDLAAEIESARISIEEVSKSADDYSRGVEFNPERLEFIRERLGDLDRLCRRYGGSLEAVIEFLEQSRKEFTVASDFESELKRIQDAILSESRILTELAWKISTERKQLAGEIELKVCEQLKELGMPDARFEIRISQELEVKGWIHTRKSLKNHERCSKNSDFAESWEPESSSECERYRARITGVDKISFFLSANKGEELRRLSRVASGGEISRIMLALKSVLARAGGVPVLVFDEIDAGISGNIAFRVSESLQDLAHYHQLLVITHLPQVAARAQTHYRVAKYQKNSRTATSIVRLDDDQRQIEIATLLSGESVTAAALKSARELIEA